MITAIGCITAPSHAQNAQPLLRDVLSRCGCLVASMPPELLATKVEDSEFINDEQGFVFAYHYGPFVYPTPDPLRVIAGNTRTGTWKQVEFVEQPLSSDARDWSGNVWEVRRLGPFIVVGQRVATDAIAESVLTGGLQRLGVTLGIIEALLPGNLVLYEHALPHGGIHWVNLAAVDLKSRVERDIYPPKPPDRVRREAIDADPDAAIRVDEADNDLLPEKAAVDQRRGTVAFGLRYTASRVSTVVVCSGIKAIQSITCHETPLTEWQKLFPKETTQQILGHAASEPGRVPWE